MHAQELAAFGGVNSQLATLTATIFRPLGPRIYSLKHIVHNARPLNQFKAALSAGRCGSRGYHILMCLHSLREVFKSGARI